MSEEEDLILGKNRGEKRFNDYWPSIVHDDYFVDYLAIAKFLSGGPTTCMSAFVTLEKSLTQRCGATKSDGNNVERIVEFAQSMKKAYKQGDENGNPPTSSGRQKWS
ncbi:hypothetical protein PK69_14815 [Xanthomonas phaseoli pv. phaseoli]|uniref:Uncharacterized protein n=1 Tax=Xanthomonas campestris pv. phaseoli TaxID=317013 RepID=A0AB34QG63_XANCH|nr:MULTISPECIES: hypothetical protein [Xanthomonas]ATS22944.1 hypothetical protein XppCFBP412P_17020 [Xanthomonas phaseoli pv. phaseoli]ATS25848.1 hypothetical protein XppCFBP6164P_10000 [Xanthomonas phaseoli pv. phaseoli]ATS30652.1 hypothetical protein XppCFBP6546P_13720 [Xanthomonas phaseoli pv. phaseoli]ATS34101.1 hypothetical protein XppCFBP6982P_09430 [Xanthomonas phaseoli pv. phaseoli]AZU15099.1 hypothetical protein AC609_20950 [Xanthomonas phaseoli pv. phaseoli]